MWALSQSRWSLLAILVAAAPLSADEKPLLELRGFSRSGLTAADLQALPRVKVTIDDHGKPATYEGVSMRSVLERLGAPLGERLRGGALTTVVVFHAADRYRVAFTLADFDPAFSSKVYVLADRRDGRPLDEKEGPLRLAVGDEENDARMIWQVVAIELRALAP